MIWYLKNSKKVLKIKSMIKIVMTHHIGILIHLMQ
jgi:hypothetical protein